MDQMLDFTNDDCNILFFFYLGGGAVNYFSSIGVLVHKHFINIKQHAMTVMLGSEHQRNRIYYMLLTTSGGDECTVGIQLDNILKYCLRVKNIFVLPIIIL